MKTLKIDIQENNVENPKVSVIIPCYNAGGLISYALDSLVSQSFKDFEVVIVNDGSKDNSVEVINRYKGVLDIKLISQENEGVSTARNVAMEHCRGKYIVFLDSDDQYHTECIAFLVSEIEEKNVDIVTSRYRFSKDYTEEFETINCTKKIISKAELYQIYNYKRIQKVNFVNCIFVNRIIQENKILFSKDLKYGEDSLFLLEYLFHCNRGAEVTDAVLYKYMVSEESASKARNFDRTQIIEAFKRAKNIWDAEEMFDKSISQYGIDRAIWAQAKDFAIADKKLLKCLQNKYDVSKAMKNLFFNSKEKMVKISAGIYCISPRLFIVLIYLFSLL